MEQRLSLVTLGVGDLAASRAFYKRLGWTESPPSNESVAFFQCGGMVFALWGRDALVEDAGVAAPGKGFANVSLAQNVRSKEAVDAVLAEAKKAGATILKPGAEAFWGGYTGYFADPDGFAWEVAWNPGFEILADGSIKLPG
jgi:predicted lactoylglutathione lyase